MSSQSQSPRGGPLAKLRRNKGLANASSTSLTSSSGEGEDVAGKSTENVADSSRLRGSIDAAIEKVRDRTSRRGSLADDRRNSEEPVGRRLSTLVFKTKRRIRKDRDDDVERNLSIDYLDGMLNGNQSDSSLHLNGSGRSSLLTEDERLDLDNKPIRPTLSPRHSHAGYLSFSSPELNAQTSPIADAVHPPEAVSEPDPLSTIPQLVVPPSNTDTLPTSPAPARSPSPGDLFRGKFNLSRKKSRDSSDPGKSGVGSGGGSGGAGGLGGLFKPSSRRNSAVEPPASESPPKPDAALPSTLKGRPVPALDLRQDRPETPQQRGRSIINTALPATPPNLLDTLTTLVTPPTPTDFQYPTFRPTSPTEGSPAARSLNSVESIRHRRAQSANLPSKLSNSINAPLTPTVEEAKTPGGSLTQPPQAETTNSFFSTFFSAATKAAGSVGSTISLPSQKSKTNSSPQLVDVAQGGEEVIPGSGSRPGTAPAEGQKKPLAVETLGKGDLSFSHLGISESTPNLMASAIEPPLPAHLEGQDMSNSAQDRKVEEEAAARAVSSAYEKPVAAVISQATGSNRPMSIASNERLTLGEQTPPRSGADPENKDIKRSGSVRSKLSGRRKHRGSSATAGTSNSIAAALKDSTTGLANPGVHGIGHRLTGFAVASSKRNKDFHQQFRSVPEDDYLIEDYSAALQRDILLHGRLYISEGHICFSSNILGWVTNLVISFDEVVSVEKKSTAVIFPNAIVISTLQARNTFASLVARDSTYDLLIGIWKISHPNLKSSVNGVMLDTPGTGDRTEVADAPEDDERSTDGSEDEVYDEDADDDAGSFTDGGIAASDAGSNIGDLTLSRKTSGIPVAALPQPNGIAPKGLETADAVVTGAAVSSEFLGPATHEPTECTESAEHYDRPLTDTTIPAPLGKVYGLMFGPASGAFMKKWLVEDQKSRDLNYDDKTGLDNDHKSFTFDYIKPLNAPVGPKQTKCITTNTLKAYNLEKAISVDCSTSTPDVPSGGSFTTRTRYCLMWGPNNSTRIIASCTIEWTAKSWLKGAIEKGANDGQIEYVKSIVAALKAAVTSKPPVKGQVRKGKRKGKKEVFDAEEAIAQREPAVSPPDASRTSWGLLEPIRPIVDPILSIIRPFITSEVIIAILFLLLAYTWFFSSSRGGPGVAHYGYSTPERIAAYEEIWRREESALWDWLEDRVGLEGVYTPQVANAAGQQERQKILQAKSMEKKLQGSGMSERQMDDAIRTTEVKLAALKEAVKRKKARVKRA